MYIMNLKLTLNSPLEQFEIILFIFNDSFLGRNFFISNTTIFLLIGALLITFFTSISYCEKLVIPNKWQFLMESLYGITISMILDNIGLKGEKYLPLLFTLFLLLLFCNLVGMVPYTFTVTSHIAFTFGLAFALYIGINIIGIRTHGIQFLSIFLPKGVPFFIIPLLVVIELISYIIKVFTLAIRLFANITSGHTLLKIIASFGFKLGALQSFMSIFAFIPLIILFGLTGLELGIAILQAYVFALLTCIYLNDVLTMH
uniref:ATP synthase F0 subunit 6 n=1 Tax=Madagascaria erythrocladioides TaxID=753684 RepID=UPI001FCCCC72|nr:ATP synthase F0 subunit 6 [Madagascaria erythrocladioides]UNJ18796.1 ATP synthase F0 subunit 6 [Madagascaria erythrocladioides]